MQYGKAILLAIVVPGMAACDATIPSRAPLAPTVTTPAPASPPQPAPTSTQLVAFTDPVSGPTTPDLRDVDDQTVHINTADELIWAADGTRFAEFIAVGNFIAYHHKTDVFFQIRFGTRDGQRRAYIGWPDHHLAGRTPTIADLWVDEGGGLRIAETDVAIPGM